MATTPYLQTVIGIPPSSAPTSNEMYTLLVDPPLPRFIAWVSLDRFYWAFWLDSGDRCEVGVLIIYFHFYFYSYFLDDDDDDDDDGRRDRVRDRP
jgi:hypothetical protein